MPTIDTNTRTQAQPHTGVCSCVCYASARAMELCADLLFHLLRFGLLRFINFSTSSANNKPQQQQHPQQQQLFTFTH